MLKILSLFLLSSIAYSLELIDLKKRTKDMFIHAYDSYMNYAFPFDELQPLTCNGRDTWGSFSLTLVDSLDMLVIVNNASEFTRASDLLLKQFDVNKDVNISVFETNIRVVGGLLSAHFLSGKTGMKLEPSWPCSGPLLRLAKKVAEKLLHAFDTITRMPYGTVNMATGSVPPFETSVSSVAGIGTFIIEFGTLSRLTGDPRFEKAALKALRSIFRYRSKLGLLGNHIDVQTGIWTAEESTIGTGTDSLFEYLVKGSILFRNPEFHSMFTDYKSSIDKHLKVSNWHYMVHKDTGTFTMPVFQSLEAFWPSILILTGNIKTASEHIISYHKVWKRYGFLPEFYNVISESAMLNKASAPLRPEFAESVLYSYQATKDPIFIEIGADILFAIEKVAKTECGYATIRDVKSHSLENRMESFFLAETVKYLYLLFDEENFLNQPYNSLSGILKKMPSGQECRLLTGGWIFNTEAHPIDPASLDCCLLASDYETDEIDILSYDSGDEDILDDFLPSISKILVDNLSDSIEFGFSNKSDHKYLDVSAVDPIDKILLRIWKDVILLDNYENLQDPVIAESHLQNDFSSHQLLRKPDLMTCPVPSYKEKLMSGILMEI